MADLDELEAQFPLVAATAFAAARERALAAGLSLLESQEGVLFEVFPDGRRVYVKRIEPPLYYVPGTKFIIKPL
jgi:hypothetical protein